MLQILGMFLILVMVPYKYLANKKPAEAGFLPSHPWEFSD
jgi:hypothetical protein